MSQPNWHSLSVAQVLKDLKTQTTGLTSQEAAIRLKKFGPNTLPAASRLTSWQVLWHQLSSPLVFVLLFAALVSVLLKEVADGAVIFAIIVINTAIGYAQETKASQAISRLQKIVHYEAKVWRQGVPTVVDTKDLVPGDILILEAGMKVPADARLIESYELEIVEAPLTGEAQPVLKEVAPLAPTAILAERFNFVYLGTAVSRGKGLAVVCVTGKETELGKIAKLVKETKEEITPLQEKINQVAKILSWAVLLISALLLVSGVLAGRDFLEMFLVSVAVAVAAVPEGLAIALTVILVLGAQKILKRQALVRRLIAAETLGGTTVICTDKTGTLTEGKMQVASILTSSDHFSLANRKVDEAILPEVWRALEIGVLCNDSFVATENHSGLTERRLVGDSTETALISAAQTFDLDQITLQHRYQRLGEIPFSSETRYMATLNQGFLSRRSLLVKGAPEIILQRSAKILSGKEEGILTVDHRASLIKKFERLSSEGWRLLAVAYGDGTKASAKNLLDDDVKNLVFVGVFVLRDPLRADAKAAIGLCRSAGIRPILITGDHRLTAINIAHEVGIKSEKDNVLDGAALDHLTEEQLAKIIGRIDVYARVEPRHKIRIVQALRASGEVVAMAGDGVNDAPAIKAADIGVALGSGTDVAKDTADIVLLDDSFHTIVEAVRGGRVIFDNIKKVLLYLLFSSFSEVVLIAGAILAGLPLPLLPTQILWVNIVQDSFPVFALAADPEEPGLMAERPRGRKNLLFDRSMKIMIFGVGTLVNLLPLGFIYYFNYAGYSLEYIRTFSFMAIAVGSIFYIFACRSLRQPLWRYNPLGNHYVNGAVVLGLILMLAAVYLPGLQTILHTQALDLQLVWILILIGLVNLSAIEVAKYILNRNKIS